MNKEARTIIETCDAVSADIRKNLVDKLSCLAVCGPQRRFLVTRMGSTGSAWLTKLLNSHPDVFCYHEGIIAKVFPARSYTSADILTFIDLLATDRMHDAYAAMGDVGSAWLGHILALPRSKFSTALLLRHPARVLNTRLQVFPTDQSFTQLNETAKQCIELIWGIRVAEFGPVDQIFLQDAFTFAGQVRAIGHVDLLMQIERMNEPDYCARALWQLTGLSYSQSAIESFINNPLNSRTEPRSSIADILGRLSPNQRYWYERMLGDVIEYLGYSLNR